MVELTSTTSGDFRNKSAAPFTTKKGGRARPIEVSRALLHRRRRPVSYPNPHPRLPETSESREGPGIEPTFENRESLTA